MASGPGTGELTFTNLNRSRIIKTGICSFGMSGKLFHAPFIEAHPGFELSGVVERHLSDSREKYPASRLYRSVEQLCADPEMELIVVNTPAHLHFEQAKLALGSGKHLIVEKPFTITVAQAEELNTLATDKDLFLTVYQNRRYDGDYQTVKSILDKKLLGEIREVEIRFDRFRPIPSGKEHKEGRSEGAGVLYDLSPHLVDQALQLFGWPNAIFADNWKMRKEVEAADYFELILFYDQLRVRLKATCIARESQYGYIIHGTKGSFLQQRSDLQEQQLQLGAKPGLLPWCEPPARPDGLLHTEINGMLVREETSSVPGNYMGYYDAVHKAICEGGKNPVPASDAILNMKVLEAALKSVKEQRVIPLSE